MTEASEPPVKSIPANVEAEQAVLGSLLIDPDAVIKVASFLRPEDFYRERHGWIYRALMALHERREPADFVTLVDELERQDQLEEVGGPAYITELINSTPTAIYVDHYARIVERTAILRRLIGAAGQIAELAYDESNDVDEVVDRAEAIIFGVSESRIHRDLTPIATVMADVVDQIDFLARNQNTLMGVPTGFVILDKMLGGFQKSDLIIVAGRPGMGKCVAAGTHLVDPQSGDVTTIDVLVEHRQANLLTLTDRYKIRPTTARDFVDDGLKPIYRVTTALGRTIEVTLSHPFLTVDGWRPLAELAEGAYIAVPRIIPVFGQKDAPGHEAKVLAYLLADGCLTGSNPKFTNSNSLLRNDFIEAALNFPGTKVHILDSGGTRVPTVYVSGDPEAIRAGRLLFARRLTAAVQHLGRSQAQIAASVGVSSGLVSQWIAGRCAPSPDTYVRLCSVLDVAPTNLAPDGLAAIRKNGPNSLTVWLRQQGIWGKRAHEKDIPTCVYRYTRSRLALFLNRLFACDGSVYVQNQTQPIVSYSTSSEALARSLQHLLLRFGILAKLRRKQVKYAGGHRTSYQLRITDAASLRRFIDEIGVLGKEDAIARVRSCLCNLAENTNRDVIPEAIWQRIVQAKGNRPWRQVHVEMDLPPNANLHVGKRSPSRRRLLEIARALESDELVDFAQSDVYWDRIVSIEYGGEKQVYDLTVPETHNFVANDLIVHNTSLGLSIAQNAAKRYNARVGIFSLEMSSEQLVQRLLSVESAIDSHRLRMGQIYEEEWPILMEAANTLAATNIFIDDTPGATVIDIRTKARRLYAEHGIDLILIDYMQLMAGGRGAGRSENRQQEISYISRSLKEMARELNVPVVAISQLSRAVESRSDKRPMLSDLRESGSIEQDADVVLFVYREDYYIEDTDRQNIADIIVAKHRHGSTGTVSLYFRKELTQFRDLELRREELEY